MGNDFFANIAADGIGGRMELLEERRPEPITAPECPLTPAKACFLELPPQMETPEELQAALKQLRSRYAPFLENYAPALPDYRETLILKDFLLDGKPVVLPHYGAPLGNAIQTYTSSVDLRMPSQEEAVYFCCDGADYQADVYLNGICVGMHEGFFSPFEFEITDLIRKGTNQLMIRLHNDYTFMGSQDEHGNNRLQGDKLYAATGLGYDDSAYGWHHCPPGMGLYAGIRIEYRNRIHINNLFVRPIPDEDAAEIWCEVNYAGYQPQEIELDLSIHGRNFQETVLEHKRIKPETCKTVGMGDSLTEAQIKARGLLGKGIPLAVKKGINLFRIQVSMTNFRRWEPDSPWLYTASVRVLANHLVSDAQSTDFGMRSFCQDTNLSPKGMFYLNGKPIRLRGANTMGFEQQDVYRGDFEQLIDDILLAKLCHMNFWRITQRPVQKEVYDYCDRLGLLVQTDLPLFGCMRRTKFCEGIRQAEELERHIRNHPCCILVTYINEPFPNANNEPHRHLVRTELESFFHACDLAVHLNNPDRIIKYVDGDYDPPTSGMPDNHCYPMWYNGHGIDIGALHRGYWLPVKPDWYYGCGEYGSEGLDFPEVMRNCYPQEWLREPFRPGNIVGEQTQNFHYFFYDTQDTLEEWVTQSQAHQAFSTKFMTEAFRRDNRMISNALHLFIDAWPAGWMKSIMDCRRMPKPAYFAYRNALSPILLSLRSDRLTCYSGEMLRVEGWICNDTPEPIEGAVLEFSLYHDGLPLVGGEAAVNTEGSKAACCAVAVFTAPEVKNRTEITLKAALIHNGEILAQNTLSISVFEPVEIPENPDVIFLTGLSPGVHEIAGETVTVKPCGMLPVHFVSRKTGHPSVKEFREKDFRFWYDKKQDRITPLLSTTFTAPGFTPILTSGNLDDNGQWGPALAAAEKYYNGKRYIICQVELRQENPVAQHFLARLLSNQSPDNM